MTISAQNIKYFTSENDNMEELPSIKAIRQARGYSVDDIALTCGLTHDEIVGVEDGTIKAIDKLSRITAALQIPVESVSEFRTLPANFQ